MEKQIEVIMYELRHEGRDDYNFSYVVTAYGDYERAKQELSNISNDMIREQVGDLYMITYKDMYRWTTVQLSGVCAHQKVWACKVFHFVYNDDGDAEEMVERITVTISIEPVMMDKSLFERL